MIEILIAIVLFFLSIPLASAVWYGTLGSAAEQFLFSLQEFLGPLFEALLNTSQFDEFFFYKLLLFFLMIFVVYLALKNVPLFKDNTKIARFVAIIIALIAARYLTEIDLIETILISYGTLAVALTTILPFMVYFFFVHNTVKSGVGRRVAWIFYMLVLLGLWINRYDAISEVGNFIYFGIFVASILLLVFDKKVREYFMLSEMQKTHNDIRDEHISRAWRDYHMHLDTWRQTGSKNAYNAAKRQLEHLKKLGVSNVPEI